MAKNTKETKQQLNNFSVKEDGSQVFLYKTPGFFSFIKKNVFPENNPFTVTDHWHDEVEFVYCTKGSLLYTVDGITMTLKEGQGLFINSRKLHVAATDADKPCEWYCVILHPLLLCASKYVDRTYVEPVIKNTALKYLFLDVSNAWQKTVLDQIEAIYEASREEEPELKIQMIFFGIWQSIYEHGKGSPVEKIKPNHHLNTLKEMITFIQQHYQEKITLEDISSAGCVGKTMCTKLFTTYVNRTPFEFLKDYRVEQSIVLLKTTDLSITDISYETGFSSPSYFGECFRKTTGSSPLEYRKNN